MEQQVISLEDDKSTLQQAKHFVDGKCHQFEIENKSLRQELERLKGRAPDSSQSKAEYDCYRWKEICQQLQQEKLELLRQLTNVDAKLGNETIGVEQLECLVPIDNEVQIQCFEGGPKSAALEASPLQSRFLQVGTFLFLTNNY